MLRAAIATLKSMLKLAQHLLGPPFPPSLRVASRTRCRITLITLRAHSA